MKLAAVVVVLGICACAGSAPHPQQPAPAVALDPASNAEAIAATKLVDAGRPAEAIAVFQRLLVRYPRHPSLLTELAQAYLAAKDAPHALSTLEPLRGTAAFASPQYVVWASALDVAGKPAKAFAAFDEGIAKFPADVRLYTNAGITAMNVEKYDQALRYFEAGIAIDPTMPSNYFYAAIVYAGSSEHIWSLLYGEIFMNLEPGTARTGKMSALLYRVFLDSIKVGVRVGSKQQIDCSFSAAANTPGHLFETSYELSLARSLGAALLASEATVNLDAIASGHANFLTTWTSLGRPAYPLFTYQQQLAAAGHADAYAHWLLNSGDEAAFHTWHATHKAALDALFAWLSSNPLKPTAAVLRSHQHD